MSQAAIYGESVQRKARSLEVTEGSERGISLDEQHLSNGHLLARLQPVEVDAP